MVVSVTLMKPVPNQQAVKTMADQVRPLSSLEHSVTPSLDTWRKLVADITQIQLTSEITTWNSTLSTHCIYA